MKKLFITLMLIAVVHPGRCVEPTLDDIQKELTLTKARLELAEARLALAAKEKELDKLANSGGDGTAKPTEGEKAEEAAKKLKANAKAQWKLAVDHLKGLLPLQRSSVLGANGISEANWVDLMDRPVNPFALADSKQPVPGSAADKRQRFLVRYGYGLKEKAAALAKAEIEEDQTKAVEEYGATGVIDVPVKSAEDVLLRNAGLSFAQGFGVAFGSKSDGDASLGTVIARWNWLQRSAAAKWNRWVGQNNAEGYAQVPYRGKIEYWEGVGKYTDILPATRRHRTLPEFTAFGPFFGSGAVGEKVSFGPDTERPYLVGLTFGWGFLDEAASLLYVDVGATVSPNSGFEHSRFFAGVSMDAIIFSKVFGLTRKAKADGE